MGKKKEREPIAHSTPGAPNSPLMCHSRVSTRYLREPCGLTEADLISVKHFVHGDGHSVYELASDGLLPMGSRHQREKSFAMLKKTNSGAGIGSMLWGNSDDSVVLTLVIMHP
jgi:hypothetical protein